MTSCTPTPLGTSLLLSVVSNPPLSGTRAGYLLGTTRTVQWDKLNASPWSRKTMTSGGVMVSFPAQKGHRAVSEASGCIGLFALSVAMMTQRSLVGSFLNSGIEKHWDDSFAETLRELLRFLKVLSNKIKLRRLLSSGFRPCA